MRPTARTFPFTATARLRRAPRRPPRIVPASWVGIRPEPGRTRRSRPPDTNSRPHAPGRRRLQLRQLVSDQAAVRARCPCRARRGRPSRSGAAAGARPLAGASPTRAPRDLDGPAEVARGDADEAPRARLAAERRPPVDAKGIGALVTSAIVGITSSVRTSARLVRPRLLARALHEQRHRPDLVHVAERDLAAAGHAGLERAAVVGGHHDQGAVVQPRPAQPPDERPQLAVHEPKLQQEPLLVVTSQKRIAEALLAVHAGNRVAHAVAGAPPGGQVQVRDVGQQRVLHVEAPAAAAPDPPDPAADPLGAPAGQRLERVGAARAGRPGTSAGGHSAVTSSDATMR